MNMNNLWKRLFIVLFCCFQLSYTGLGQLDSLKNAIDKLPYGKEKIEGWSDLIDIYSVLSNGQAMAYCDSILMLSKKIKYDKGIGLSYYKRASVYFEAEDYEKAIYWTSKTTQFCQKNNYEDLLAKSYNFHGVVEKKTK